jgi:hypothetical protein
MGMGATGFAGFSSRLARRLRRSARSWVDRWVGVEAAERVGEEAMGAEEVVAALVLEGCGDLDEALQERLVGGGSGEPDGFPGLVGGEVFGCVIAAQTFG